MAINSTSHELDSIINKIFLKTNKTVSLDKNNFVMH